MTTTSLSNSPYTYKLNGHRVTEGYAPDDARPYWFVMDDKPAKAFFTRSAMEAAIQEEAV